MTEARTNFTEVPLVDVAGLRGGDAEARRQAVAALDRAARDVGFVYVTGHGIPEEVIAGLRGAAERFFALPEQTKAAYYIGRSTNHRGYVPRGEEVYASAAGTPSGDLKEAFDTALDLPADDPDYLAGNRMLGPNVWPREVDGFAGSVTAYYEAAMALGKDLLRGFALGLGLAEDAFTRCVNRPTSQLRLIHYWETGRVPGPPPSPDQMGIGAHTDYECFTILLPTAPGLQVMNGAGDWVDVPPVEGALVINIGDMLEIWSNGAYVATSHRVKTVPEERYSFPLFFAVDYDTVVAPHPDLVPPGETTKYTPLKAGDHLVAQTIHTFTYLQRGLADNTVALPDGSLEVNQFGRFHLAESAPTS